MNENENRPVSSPPIKTEIAVSKKQQEANREARLRQLQTPAERWRWQQKALAELARLRPDLARKCAQREPE